LSDELLVAGSIALDSLDGEFGSVREEMGGSALYFALAASLIMPVRIVAPVGQESLATVKRILGSRPIDVEYLDVLDAPTYRWRARQESGRNIDRGSQDSIYDRWKPRVPAGYQGWAFVGSMRPDRQALLTIELGHSSLLAADAMLSYLQSQPEEARDVLRHSHWYFCNHEEFAALGGHEPAEFRRRWSLDGLVIKAGPRGVTAYTELGSTHVPALPSQRVVDTTGAGDAIAAGMMAHWIAAGADPELLQESLVWGVACASITISDIGLRAIAAATREQLHDRVEEVDRCLRRES